VTRSSYRELKPRDGFLLVSTVWALMAAIATIPLLLVYDSMSFTDAFFETMSGLTTTGSTIMTDLDHAPEAINLWRHELNWLGGMGIIVLAVAVLPLLGVGGMQLYKAETPGPMKDSKLTARIADTAKALWLVYFLITVACILLLNQAGLSWLTILRKREGFRAAFAGLDPAAVARFGATRGSWLAINRLLRCHPLCDGGCDPVPMQFSWKPFLRVKSEPGHPNE